MATADRRAPAVLTRTALAGLAAATLGAISPASTQASIAPSVAVNQAAGTTGGSSPATGFDINFNPQGGDSVKNLAIGFPPGFLLNLETAGGACIASSTPTPGCGLGSGTINGPTGTPATLYLVAPSKNSDIAGVALVIEGRPTAVGDLTLGSSPAVGFNLSFSGLAPGINELQFTLSGPRLPTSCNAAHNVTVGATSQAGTSGSASAPVAVTGCGSLPFAPTVGATVTKDSGSSGALVVATVTQAAGESASSAIALKVPSDLKVSKVLGPCLEGAPCTVGSVQASSPLLPSSALANGTLTLGGTLSQTTLTMAFPPPYAFALAGAVSLTERTITFSGLPDLPLTGVSLMFTGVAGSRAFTTSCAPGTITATLTPADGSPAHAVSGAITTIGCPAQRASSKASASGSLSGLASGKPKLRMRAADGSNGPGIASLSIRLPAGLQFDARALAAGTACGGAASGHRNAAGRGRCARRRSLKGLSLSGAAIKRARLVHGALVITLSGHAARVSLTARGPLIAESRALESRAKRHRTGRLVVSVRITDANGAGSVVSLH
jgi:hypothetical protein